MKWNNRSHSAHLTKNFLFSQLIPYIGNKRKLLDLIQTAINKTETQPSKSIFIDCFAGTGVVSRLAKLLGYQVICNDWEHYSYMLNLAAIKIQKPPLFFDQKSYQEIIEQLNVLPDKEDWISKHLCPDDDENFDLSRDRMFYMRKNGLRLDAIREQIAQWERNNILDSEQKACLIAPLLYSACYHANTSGVFKGFHKGWGGQTATALYRIAANLKIHPLQFYDNKQANEVFCMDAQKFAALLCERTMNQPSVAYLDPPYNQHPYASNYHVLNSISLWDKPVLSPKITKQEKAAIRSDWRESRRSAYNSRKQAIHAYAQLINTLPTDWIATSYSTDGFITLEDMIHCNCNRGKVYVFARAYKRYRVSSQRYSHKPRNIEFVILTQTRQSASQSARNIAQAILDCEAYSLSSSYKNEDTIVEINL